VQPQLYIEKGKKAQEQNNKLYEEMHAHKNTSHTYMHALMDMWLQA